MAELRHTEDQQIIIDCVRSGRHPRDNGSYGPTALRRFVNYELGKDGPDTLITVHLAAGGTELWRVAPDGRVRAV